jgi:beta-lactamase regulating signal transducer with metallopeptidase domain
MNTLDVSRTLWDYYLWASVLLAATLLAFLVIRQPARRMAIAWATAGGLLVLLVLTAVPNWSRYSLASPAPPITPLAERSETVAVPAAVPTRNELRSDSPPTMLQLDPPVPVATEIDWELLTLVVLGLGSMAVACWLALGSWQARRLRGQSLAAPSGVAELFAQLAPHRHQEIELGIHRELPVAVALGLRRPCILLPQTLVDQASAGQLRSVLAHELAHVEHRDLWLLAVLRLVTVVLWPHPLFWLLRRQVRHDQEVLADMAAAALTTRVDYAEQLVALARAAVEVRIPRLASSVGLWEKRTQLTERIKLLLDEQLTILRNCSRGWRLGSAGMLAALALGLSLVTLTPAENTASQPTVLSQQDRELLIQADRGINHEVLIEAATNTIGSIAAEDTPSLLVALKQRASSYARMARDAEAIADFEAILKLAPDDYQIMNNLACLLAASPDDSVRDGNRAVDLAKVAAAQARQLPEDRMSSWHLVQVLDTLSSAYAEVGDFENAIKIQQEVIERAGPAREAVFSEHLQQYKAGRPLRENALTVAKRRKAESELDANATVKTAEATPAPLPMQEISPADAERIDRWRTRLNKLSQSPPQPNEIRGMCVDENYEPLPGVKVEAFAIRGQQKEPRRIATTVSDAKGEFHFKNVIDIAQEFPGGLPKDGIFTDESCIVTVIGRLPGRALGDNGSELAFSIAKQGMNIVTLRMPPAETLRGRVVNTDNRPVVGARVTAIHFARLPGIPENVNSAKTDAEGRFEITDLEAYDAEQARKEFEATQQDFLTFAGSGMPWDRFITVEHPDFARKRAKITSIPGSVEVTLSPGAVLTGRVMTQEVGAEPKPAANADVMAMLLPAAETPNSLSYQVLSAKTDEAGNYRFESLPQGDYAVQAYLPDWVTNGIEDVKVATGETVAVPPFTMTRGGRVRIQLVDDSTGKPLTFDKPTKAYVNPVQRPMKRNTFAVRSNVAEFSQEGIGEIQVPAGNYLFNVVIPSGESGTRWMRADFNANLSTEDIEKVPGQRINEGEVVEIEVRMVGEGEPAEDKPTGRLIPATVPAESETSENSDKHTINRDAYENGVFVPNPSMTVPRR